MGNSFIVEQDMLGNGDRDCRLGWFSKHERDKHEIYITFATIMRRE